MARPHRDAERRARMEAYCERLRDELISLGVLPERLLGLRAGRLSELVITERRAKRRSWPAEMSDHPSTRRRR